MELFDITMEFEEHTTRFIPIARITTEETRRIFIWMARSTIQDIRKKCFNIVGIGCIIIYLCIFFFAKDTSTLQITQPNQWATWLNGLVEQLKSPGVFIASNEASRLRHPVRLNVCKHQRKADRLHSLRFFRSQFLSYTPPFLYHNRRIIEFAILRLRQTFLKILNSQKYWTKTQYREFKGPATAMGGNWMTKIAAEKIENYFSKMLDEYTILRIRGSCNCNGEFGWQKSWPKILYWCFRFFQPRFSSPNFPSSQSQNPQICDIVSSSNIFENLPITITEPSNLQYCVFVKQFWEF